MIKSIGAKVGRFLSEFTYVLSSLVVYVGLSVVTYIWLKVQIAPEQGSPFFITYRLATGSDPNDFMPLLQGYTVLWSWVLAFHVLSWLIVPVLAATAIDAAFRAYEERRTELSESLTTRIEELITKELQIPSEQANILAAQLREIMEKRIKLKRRN